MLNDLAIQNEQLFHELDVDMSRFGQHDITGIKDVDGDPCPRTWDPIRQYWSDDWKRFIFETEAKELEEYWADLNYRLSDKCRDPKKLIDIVKAG